MLVIVVGLAGGADGSDSSSMWWCYCPVLTYDRQSARWTVMLRLLHYRIYSSIVFRIDVYLCKVAVSVSSSSRLLSDHARQDRQTDRQTYNVVTNTM